MRPFLRALFAVLIAVAAFEGGSAEAAKKPTKAERRASCEKAKRASNYDTPIGRAAAKARCQRGGYTSATYWKERARQMACLQKTGVLCEK